ncbi:MAG: Spy/CpxP family protein refolding chaperone [Pseudanabaena sp. ELA748]
MFKSKIFQYCAIATAVIGTTGAIWANTATLQSQSPMQSQQIQSLQPESQDLDLLAKAPINPERPDNADMPSGRMLKQLNLSPEQLQKLKAVRDRDQVRMRELVEQSRQAGKELRDLLAGTESSDVIRAKHNQVLNLQQELRKQHFERMLAMREILTPQQRKQLSEIMQKNRQPRMRENMQENMRDRVKNRMEKRIDSLGERPTL